MSDFSIGRRNQFRNIHGKLWNRQSQTHTNVKVGVGQNLSNVIKSNGEFLVMPYKRTGGWISYRRIDQFGKWSEEPDELIYAHKKILNDFEFCQHRNVNLLATASSDDPVKLWKLPPDPQQYGLAEKIVEPVSQLATGAPVLRVGFHPLVKHCMFTGHTDLLQFWDLETQKPVVKIAHEGFVMDTWSFNFTGGEMVAGCKDKKIRLFDIRSPNPLIGEQEVFPSLKPFNVYWCDHADPNYQFGKGAADYLFAIGFNKAGERELALWDRRLIGSSAADGTTALARQIVDTAGGSVTPCYDPDIRVMYLCGKGDTAIRYYEIIPEAPFVDKLSEFESPTPQAACVMLPKLLCDVNQFELARFLRLTSQDIVETVSFKISRHEKISQYFQEDIFQDTWDREPVCNASEWFSNTKLNKAPQLINLKPADKISIFDVPEEQGGKKCPPKPIVACEPKEEKVYLSSILTRFFMWSGLEFWWLIRFFFIAVPFYLYKMFTQPSEPQKQLEKIIIPPLPSAQSIMEQATSPVDTRRDTITTEVATNGSEPMSGRSSHSTTESSQSPTSPIIPEPPATARVRPLQERLESGAEVMRLLDITDPEVQKLKAHESDPTLKCVEIDSSEVKKGNTHVLFRIRGRKRVRIGIVAPSYKSFTNADSFVLDCGPIIFQWNAEKVNRIVPAAALELASALKNKERGGNATVCVFNYGKEPESIQEKKQFAKFYKNMGLEAEKGREANERLIDEVASQQQDNKLMDDEDEDKWINLVDSNLKIYQVSDNASDKNARLIAVDISTSRQPSKNILDSNYCYIISEFNGNETYCWIGKKSKSLSRKWAIVIGRKYADWAARNNDNGFATFIRANEEAETIAFKQKFADFPANLSIGMAPKLPPVNISKAKAPQGIDLQELLKARAKLSKVKSTIIPQAANESIKIWRIDKADKIDYPMEYHGHFFSADAYIVLYSYEKVAGGKKHHKIYFWQGRDAKHNEKGKSAFKTVQLGGELSDPSCQIRVIQTREPRHFLKLFAGSYIVHKGHFYDSFFKKQEQPCNDQPMVRMYDIRGTVCEYPEDEENSTHAIQWDTATAINLHSFYNSMIHVHYNQSDLQDKLIIWHGRWSTEMLNKVTNRLVSRMQQTYGQISVQHVTEGQEEPVFWAQYFNNMSQIMRIARPPMEGVIPRLYCVDESSGTITIRDVSTAGLALTPMTPSPSSRGPVVKSGFSKDSGDDPFDGPEYRLIDGFSEEELESEKCYLLDDVKTGYLFVWIGTLASIVVKKFALKSCQEYSEAVKKANQLDKIMCYTIVEHQEPAEFVAAFHCWSDLSKNNIARQRKSESVDKSKNDGTRKLLSDCKLVNEELTRLTTRTYSFERLTQFPLPEGVDTTQLETYLDDDEFTKVLQTSREEFAKTPRWKREERKKSLGLF